MFTLFVYQFMLFFITYSYYSTSKSTFLTNFFKSLSLFSVVEGLDYKKSDVVKGKFLFCF